MRSTYARYGISSEVSPRTPRDRAAPRSYYSSSVSTTRVSRDAVSTRDRDTSDNKEESDSDTADGYADLRAKMRTLQREATRATANLEALNREKEELSVALSHAKRDKAKVIADSEVVELERDSLERENRRIKTKLEAASKELRDLAEERRQLAEKLRVVDGTNINYIPFFTPHIFTNLFLLAICPSKPNTSHLKLIHPSPNRRPLLLSYRYILGRLPLQLLLHCCIRQC